MRISDWSSDVCSSDLALAWRLAQSPGLETLYAAPCNPGIAAHAELASIDPAEHRGVIDFCLRHSIGLVVIGHEAPLVDGLADNIRTMGIAVFGPGRDAARPEGPTGRSEGSGVGKGCVSTCSTRGSPSH